jgi:ABC transporter substrate binding protein
VGGRWRVGVDCRALLGRWATSGGKIDLRGRSVLGIGGRTRTDRQRSCHQLKGEDEHIADPIGGGFVATVARPGDDITGFISIEPPPAGKWLQILKQAVPQVRRVAVLYNPETASYWGESSLLPS